MATFVSGLESDMVPIFLVNCNGIADVGSDYSTIFYAATTAKATLTCLAQASFFVGPRRFGAHAEHTQLHADTQQVFLQVVSAKVFGYLEASPSLVFWLPAARSISRALLSPQRLSKSPDLWPTTVFLHQLSITTELSLCGISGAGSRSFPVSQLPSNLAVLCHVISAVFGIGTPAVPISAAETLLSASGI